MQTFLLIALVAALVGHVFTTPVKLPKFFSSKKKSAAPANSDAPAPIVQDGEQQIWIPNAQSCSPGYQQRMGGCVLNGVQFHLETQNGLINTYRTNSVRGNSNTPEALTAHHVVFTVLATLPGSGKKVPVPGMPVDIVPTEDSQLIMTVEQASGTIKEQTVLANKKFRGISNAQGRAAFSFPITNDDSAYAQEMNAQAGYMTQKESFSFHADTATMRALGSVTSQQLQKAKPDMPTDVADLTAERVRLLIGIPADNNNRVYVDPTRQTIPVQQSAPSKLSKRGSAKDLVAKDWEKIKKEVIRTVEIIKEGTGKVVKAIIQTAQKVYEIIVATVVTAVKVLGQLLKLVGLGVKTVIDAVKYVIRWDEVLNTQMQFIHYLNYVRDNTRPLLESKRTQVVKTFSSLKGSFGSSIDGLIEKVKGHSTPETDQYLEAVNKKGGVAEYTFVTDLIMSNGDKATFPNANQQVVQQIVAQVEIIEQEAQQSGNAELVAQCGEVKKNLGLKGVGTDIVVALLTLVKGVFGIVSDIISVTVDFGIRLIEVALELYWILLTLEVKIPIVSTLYKYIISNGRYELSLMSLATLPPAIAYTYG
ncbi:hypothetical protein HK102_012708, partial [Quaeritorhiza haematococci]